jgi:hypothetical protein
MEDHEEARVQQFVTISISLFLPFIVSYSFFLALGGPPRHHSMARPPAMEGSCKYIEDADGDKRKGVDLQLGVEHGLTVPHLKKKFVAKCLKDPWT